VIVKQLELAGHAAREEGVNAIYLGFRRPSESQKTLQNLSENQELSWRIQSFCHINSCRHSSIMWFPDLCEFVFGCPMTEFLIRLRKSTRGIRISPECDFDTNPIPYNLLDCNKIIYLAGDHSIGT